eukprot:13716253-Alexandrium_andersonii.AAC.1
MKAAEEKYARETTANQAAMHELSEACVSGSKLQEELQTRLSFSETKHMKLLSEHDQLVAAAQRQEALLLERSEEINNLTIAHSNIREEHARARL